MVLDEEVAVLRLPVPAVDFLLQGLRRLHELVLGAEVPRLRQVAALLVVVDWEPSWLHIWSHFVEVVLREATQIEHSPLLRSPLLEQLVGLLRRVQVTEM